MSSPARSSDDRPRRRILYLVTADISARFLRGQLGHLVDHGFEVTVGTRRSDPPAEVDDGVDVVDIAFEREPSPLADLRAAWRTVRLVRRLRPDIVNASTPKAGLLGMLAARLAQVPVRVYVVRGLRFETLTGVRRRLFVALERLATACATDVVYNSPSLRSVAEREHAVAAGRGVVLGAGSGNGVDVDRFDELPSRAAARRALGLPAEGIVIGFVGRLTRDKGIVDLVDAFDGLDDDAVLLLVGDHEPGDPVPDATRRRIDASPRIVRVPWTDDTRTAYRAMDVLAFPSYREGLPNVPLEAQLSGVPVVAYAATGTVDAIAADVGGRFVPVGSVDGLRDALGDVLTDADLRRRLGTSGRHWVIERFDRTTIWGALLDLYGAS